MARHLVTDPAVQPLVQDLIHLVLHEGSVNGSQQRLVAMLAEDKSEGWIYPNRLHTLLTGDPSKAVNSETIDVVRLALNRLPEELIDAEHVRERAAELRQAILHRWETAELDGDPATRAVRIAEILNLPPAVVMSLLADAGIGQGAVAPAPTEDAPATAPADWSFQDEAHRRCIDALERDPNRKVGLILPTGAGKTRVAIRIGLSALARSDRDDSIILWVTHRTRLKTQAHRELQRAVTSGTADIPENAAALLARRFEFIMLGDLEQSLQEYGDRLELVIVDEAHHAAAQSYAAIFEHRPLRSLFLTATPNRTDLLPIGIDEIAYTITSRQLFECGVILEPKLETWTLEGFDWGDPSDLRDLADAVMTRAQDDFAKTLIAVSRVEHAEVLYEALMAVHDEYDDHVLDADDIGFVHGGRTSTQQPAEVFLDEFAARPRGIVVATSSLLGEGFDDPATNAAVVTFPTSSVLQLMQVAGRSLRSASGKAAAYVVQVRDSTLSYHWEQRWLYQDISDLLRPQLGDMHYSSFEDLTSNIESILEAKRVPDTIAQQVRADLATVEIGERVSLLLTGFPYDGAPEDFQSASEWNVLLITPRTRDLFLRVFNDFSGRAGDIADYSDYLRNFLNPDPAPASSWKRYIDMLYAMTYAQHEISSRSYDGEGSRPYASATGTTWLIYIDFQYQPVIDSALDEFLAEAVNRDEVLAAYLNSPETWRLAVKILLPLAGTVAFLLEDGQAAWIAEQRQFLRVALQDLGPTECYAAIARWRHELIASPVPLLLVDHFDRFLREEAMSALTLSLPVDAGTRTADGAPR